MPVRPADAIKAFLKEKHMTQEQLAVEMGTSLQNIRQTLNKEHFRTSTLEKIAEILDVPVWRFFVTPEELVVRGSSASSDAAITCPHCGKPFKVHLSTH